MKKYLFILGLAVLAVSPAAAQRTDTVFQKREVIIVDEVPSFTHQTREVLIRSTSRNRRYATRRDELKFFNSIGLGYNGLVEGLNNLHLPEEAEWMDLKGKSVDFNMMIMSYQYNFSPHFGLRTGLELEVNNFRFENNITPALNADGIVYGRPVEYHLKKTKLVNCYFNIPLVVRVGIGSRNQLELYGGMVGGWRWNSYTKLKSSEHGKDRHRTNLNLRNFHYGYTAGITFHNVGFYASYYPHSIFQADKGPDVRQVNVGITINY